MHENENKIQNKLAEVSRLVNEFGSQSEQISEAQKHLEEMANFIENRFDNVVKTATELMCEFGSMSEQQLAAKEQLHKSQNMLSEVQRQMNNSRATLESCRAPFNNKFDELTNGVYAIVNLKEQSLRAAEADYKAAKNDFKELCNHFTESTQTLVNAFNETSFKDLCAKISELAQILEECKEMKNELLDVKANIIKEISKNVTAELSLIRAQQEENRAFLEAKFSELLEKSST